MEEKRLRVGVFGYQPSDLRIARMVQANRCNILWVATHEQPEIALEQARNTRPDVLVVNPRWVGKLGNGLEGLPSSVKVVLKAQPFGPDNIDITPTR